MPQQKQNDASTTTVETPAEPKTRKIKMGLTHLPFTTNLKLPVPGVGGGTVPYSSFLVGFTQVGLTLNEEIEVEVPASGSDLVDVGEAAKLVVEHFFALTAELARGAWMTTADVEEIYEVD